MELREKLLEVARRIDELLCVFGLPQSPTWEEKIEDHLLDFEEEFSRSMDDYAIQPQIDYLLGYEECLKEKVDGLPKWVVDLVDRDLKVISIVVRGPTSTTAMRTAARTVTKNNLDRVRYILTTEHSRYDP